MYTYFNQLLTSDLFRAAVTFGTFALTGYLKVKYGSGSTLSSNIESNSGSCIIPYVTSSGTIMPTLSRYGSCIFYPSRSPGCVVELAYYRCGDPWWPNIFHMYDATGLLIDSKTIKPWQCLNISFVTQLNGRPWINSVLIEDGLLHPSDPDPDPLISPNQYNKLDDIYYHLSNHENLCAVIFNLRDAL